MMSIIYIFISPIFRNKTSLISIKIDFVCSNNEINESNGDSQTTPFKKTILKGKNAFIVTDKIVAIDGKCKNALYGMRQVNYKRKKIPMFDFWQLDGKGNVHKDFEKYMEVCLSIMPHKGKKNSFVTSQLLGPRQD